MDPKTLHKYAYAGADPVNATDPSGRALFEYGSVIQKVVAVVLAASVLAEAIACAVEGFEGPWPGPTIGPSHPNLGCLLHEHQEPPEGAPPPAPPYWPPQWER